ncbi:hypothetical protein BpHYR1_040828 [Brachionus plicatilis]|uniref:Uncharacterized protein n=1 Tax=Brachionus plicatilis TaxID=10195 RepID=A0A3M7S0G4_BRAPC|nr:hypothetical protein BpHYR1_040828 [Brachionus plicatilis]
MSSMSKCSLLTSLSYPSSSESVSESSDSPLREFFIINSLGRQRPGAGITSIQQVRLIVPDHQRCVIAAHRQQLGVIQRPSHIGHMRTMPIVLLEFGKFSIARKLEQLDKPKIIASGKYSTISGQTSGVYVCDIGVRRPNALTLRTQHTSERVPFNFVHILLSYIDSLSPGRLIIQYFLGSRIQHHQLSLHIPFHMRYVARCAFAYAHPFLGLHIVDVHKIFV